MRKSKRVALTKRLKIYFFLLEWGEQTVYRGFELR